MEAATYEFLSGLKQHFPDFVDFGQDKTFDEVERHYKWELVELFRATVASSLQTLPADEPGQAQIGQDLIQLFASRLHHAGDKPQNLVGWRYWQPLKTLSVSSRARLAWLVSWLCYGTAELAERVDQFVQALQALEVRWQEWGSWPAISRSLTSFFLMLAAPEQHPYIKTREINRGLEAYGRDKLPGKPLSGADYCHVQRWFADIMADLQAAGYHPRDYIDIQSFIYVNVQAARPQTAAMSYWLLGANWGGIDKTADFLAEDYWASGHNDKFSDQVKAVQIGDRVAIKASYTRRQDLPFDNHGLTVSCMDIKATGTVRANPGDGKTLCIDWDEDFEPRTIYLFNHWRTINRIDRHKWGQVIDYIFGNAEQPLAELEAMYAERARQQQAKTAVSSAEPAKHSSLPVADNIIYYGPPGCGKTWQLLQVPEASVPVHIEMVSFHPSMSYEEFVEGLRPVVVGGALSYEVVPGIFRRLCQQAEANPDQYFRLAIDEINRADISQVLGEMISLIEPDKRAGQPNAAQVRLPYSRMLFSVPPNLSICASMNVVDRSVTLLDMALRRRFRFKRLAPQPTLLATDIAGVNLQKLLTMLNARLEYLLGPEFVLGHGYFMAVQDLAGLQQLFTEQIIPLLEEYFYEDWARLQQVLTDQNTGECHFIESQSLEPVALFGPAGQAAGMNQPGQRYRVAATFNSAMFMGLYGG